MIKTEPIAWGRKYLMHASVEGVLILIRIRGIILIKLISSPSQAINQELAEKAIIVPTTKNIKNIS